MQLLLASASERRLTWLKENFNDFEIISKPLISEEKSINYVHEGELRTCPIGRRVELVVVGREVLAGPVSIDAKLRAEAIELSSFHLRG